LSAQLQTTNNFFFAKMEWHHKAQNVLCNVWSLSFELGPIPNICATMPRLGRAEVQVHPDL
jgi:hypothetical protein